MKSGFSSIILRNESARDFNSSFAYKHFRFTVPFISTSKNSPFFFPFFHVPISVMDSFRFVKNTTPYSFPFPSLTNPFFMSPLNPPSYTFFPFSSFSIIAEPLNSIITRTNRSISYKHIRFTLPFSNSKHFPFFFILNGSYSLTLISTPLEFTSLQYPLIPSIGSCP